MVKNAFSQQTLLQKLDFENEKIFHVPIKIETWFESYFKLENTEKMFNAILFKKV